MLEGCRTKVPAHSVLDSVQRRLSTTRPERRLSSVGEVDRQWVEGDQGKPVCR